ncbi:MAG: hypothetical protein HFK09_05135 [Clostridia bacterium]|nr:hypothetical protein [Clostridia bacterium]
MKTRVRILTAIAALALIAMTFVGCGASIDYVYYTDEDNYIYDVRVNIPTELERKLESSAVPDPNFDGQEWSLLEWLYTYADMFGYEVAPMKSTERGMKVYRFIRKAPIEDDEDEEEESDTVVDVKNLFYTYRITVTMPNPFNGMRAEYDGAKPSDTSIVSVIKYGYGYLPALGDAFPAAETMDLSGLGLNFYMPAIQGGASSGKEVDVDISSGGTGTEEYIFYKFDRLFDETETTISYSYSRPNSLGWYVTIIAVGVAIVAIILFVTHKKKTAKPEAADIFPYDPEKGESSGSGLPTGYNGGGDDIFKY